ncbi:MAG TPA: dihydrolipoamide acetyltransferase family protein [Myxococcota bacterium]|nr:dihydrolipoamide acetyltransferase family protein [Myxococcota bacterium]
MATDVELPALGESVVEATIGAWLVKEGDAVEVDQPLVEVTTDKADAELPSPVAGVVEQILAAEGDTVTVGTVVARIAEGASAAKPSPRQEAPAEEEESAETPAQEEASAETQPEEEDPPETRAAPAAREADGPDEPRATPVARRMAEEQRVDLASVQGSGVAGRVTKQDVASRGAAPAPAAKAKPRPAAPAPAAEPTSLPPYMTYALQEGDKVVPMSPLRRIVAEHMVLSKRTSPHVGTVAEVDMGAVASLRNAHKRAFQEQHGHSLTFLPFIVAATVKALREFPALNASVVGDAIVERRDVNIGVAVETEKGLVVPVVRNADRLSLTGLAAAIEDLSTRARSRKISPDELRGGSFTLSNPGRQGNLYGFAIINQPQVGILRMGEIVKRPVVRDLDGSDALVIRPMMHLALSYDHRAVDGAPANGFLFRVRELLEEAEFDL